MKRIRSFRCCTSCCCESQPGPTRSRRSLLTAVRDRLYFVALRAAFFYVVSFSWSEWSFCTARVFAVTLDLPAASFCCHCVLSSSIRTLLPIVCMRLNTDPEACGPARKFGGRR